MWGRPNEMPHLLVEHSGKAGTVYQDFDFWFESPGLRMWGALFSCTYDGKVVLQPEEVESGEFMSVPVGFQLSFALAQCHSGSAVCT